MPLFKVCPSDRSKKVMVKAAALQELIDCAKTKLKIADGVYKVALDEDGTEVDDDEILLEVANLSQVATNLILLPEDLAWQPRTEVTAAANPEATKSTSTTSTVGGHNEQNPSSNSGEILGGNIWKKFPKRLTECCHSGQRAFDADRRTMVSCIADYMLHDLKDYSRATAERIAKMIVDKYPKTFSDVINNSVIGSGTDSLRQQIYNAVNYRKIDKEIKRRAEMRLSDEMAQDDPDPVPSKPRKQDEYGCTDYQPLLPPTESATSQSEKKLQLTQFFELDEKDDAVISQLMDDTYPTQRIDINKKTRNIVQLFQLWPYLQRPKYFIDHASRLLGISIQTVWEKTLSATAKPLRKYIIYTEKSKILKSRKSKDSSENEPNVHASDVLQIISEAKAASTASQADVALIAVIFPLIAMELKEDSKFFFRVIPEDVDGSTITEYAKQDYPILIIRGKSLFDEKAKCDVILEEKVAINARGVLDGFLITFLAYYVLGYVYPPELQKTLEFVQRVLLEINPKSGHKRKDTKKRKAVAFDTAVMKFSNALEAFKDD